MKNHKAEGFTLIEIVVSVAILLVIVVGSYQGYASVHTAIAHSRYRMVAADLANEQFEVYRNMPYSSVGTVGGTPSGVITAVQTFTRNGITYRATTTVQNVNDPFDGSPDSFPADYKLVEIIIGCQACKNFKPVVVTSRIAPANLESS